MTKINWDVLTGSARKGDTEAAKKCLAYYSGCRYGDIKGKRNDNVFFGVMEDVLSQCKQGKMKTESLGELGTYVSMYFGRLFAAIMDCGKKKAKDSSFAEKEKSYSARFEKTRDMLEEADLTFNTLIVNSNKVLEARAFEKFTGDAYCWLARYEQLKGGKTPSYVNYLKFAAVYDSHLLTAEEYADAGAEKGIKRGTVSFVRYVLSKINDYSVYCPQYYSAACMSAARKYLSSGKAEKIIGRKAAEKLLATLPDNNADCIYLTVAEVYTSEFKRVDYGFSFYNQRTGQRESGTGFVPFDEGVIVKSCAAVFDTDDRFANYNDYTKYLSKEVDDLPENATYYTAPYWKDEGEFEAAYRTKDELYSQFAAAARQPIGEKYGIDIKNVSIRITSPDAYKLTKKGSGYNVIDAYIPFYVYEVELGGVFYCVRVNAMNLHTEVFKTKNKETRYGQFDKKTDPYEAKDEKGRKIKKTMKDRVRAARLPFRWYIPVGGLALDITALAISGGSLEGISALLFVATFLFAVVGYPLYWIIRKLIMFFKK